jgi:hypothetical protein
VLREAWNIFTKEERNIGLEKMTNPAPNPHISSALLCNIFKSHQEIDLSKQDTDYSLVMASKAWRQSGVFFFFLATMGLFNDT